MAGLKTNLKVMPKHLLPGRSGWHIISPTNNAVFYRNKKFEAPNIYNKVINTGLFHPFMHAENSIRKIGKINSNTLIKQEHETFNKWQG